MELGALLAERIFVPFYERRWGIHPGRLTAELRASQYDSADSIAAKQWLRLRDLLVVAARECPFYRERFARLGIESAAIADPSDLQRLPILTKDDLRAHGPELIREGLRREELFHKRTGGSTGVPVHVYWDAAAHRFKRALVKRHDDWAGYHLGMRMAALWGDTDKRYPWRERVFKTLCERTLYLDTLQMDERRLTAFVRQLRAARPTILMGHAHSIYFFTQFIVEKGHDDVGFDGIISTAETLLPSERAAIEARFGNVVFDRYGCEELSLIASECEAHAGLHVAAEGLWVELIDGDGERPARLVVTDLINRAMPLIRYEVGDLAFVASGRCACGRGLPRLERIVGRTTDILFAPDGRRISGVSILDTFVIHVPGVRQAQLVQEELDHVTLRVVADSNYDQASAARLARTVQEVFGPRMRHTLLLVDSIEPTPRGKFQFTICKLDPSQWPPVSAS
jgi:phenylacetate-CoA ligase